MQSYALFISFLFIISTHVYCYDTVKKSRVTNSHGAPSFFLQDPSDSLCLAGDEFRRCSLDTLFYVVGNPGNYRVHKRPINISNEDEDGTCISKRYCSDQEYGKTQDVVLSKCTHCGAKNWNILGESDTGYVLMEGEGDNKTCIGRKKGSTKSLFVSCGDSDVLYTTFQLHFASSSDIKTMESPSVRLVEAASNGIEITIYSLLIKDKVHVNSKDWDGMTALIAASSSGHISTVELLIKEGADVNAKDKDGITALMEASIMGFTKIVELLIDSDAEIDAKSNTGVSSLWLASGGNKVDVMKILLKNHADSSVSRIDGTTALMASCVSGHIEATRILLDHGVDPRSIDNDGLTALMNAAENGSVEVIKTLLSALDEKKSEYVNIMSATGFTALIIAAAHGHADTIKYLLNEAGADAKLVHDNNVTSLMYAAASGHIDTMNVLLYYGKVNINDLHSNGGSALLEASTTGAVEAIRFLINHGARYDIIDNDGVTPLMAIASQGNVTGLNFILDSLKLDMDREKLREHINLFAFSGGSAIMFSAAGGHTEVTKILIDHGADVNAIAHATPLYKDKLKKMIENGVADDSDPHVDGVTALHVASQGGHLGCIDILIKADAEVTRLDEEGRSPLVLALKGNYAGVASSLVAGGANPHTSYVDEDGEYHNLLMDSIIVENTEFASLLIKKDIDIYYEDHHRVTTLIQASHRGMKDVVKLLLENHFKNGINKRDKWIDAASDDGITSLIAASSEGHVNVVQLLVQAKALVNMKDKDGTDSLMASSARGHVDVVKTLLDAGAKVNEQNIDGHTALMFAYNGKNQVQTLWERYKQFVNESKIAMQANLENKNDGGIGPVIRQALDNHTLVIEYLINSGADQTIKDKEGHMAEDFDFHSDSDAELFMREEIAENRRYRSINEL